MKVKDIFNSIRIALVGSTADGGDGKVVNGLKSANDAIALLIHTWALENSLDLIQVGGQDLSTNSSSGLDHYDWKSSGPNFYSFKYQGRLHNQAKTVEIEVSRRFSDEVQINAKVAGTQEDSTCRLKVGSYINTSFFSTATRESEEIADIFTSGESISVLWKLLDTSFLEGLGLAEETPSQPKLRDTQTSRILRESTDRSAADSSPSPASQGPGTPYGTPPSISTQPSRRHLPRGGDFPIGFEDEYEINGKLRLPGSSSNTRQPAVGNPQPPYLPIGDRDLNPPGIGPNPSLGPYGGGSGGMHPTMEEIMRQGRGGRGGPGSEDPDDFLMRPPGSRWDPTGPGQGIRGGRGGFGGAFGDGGFGGGFGGDFI